MYFGHEQTVQWCRAVADIAATHPAVRDEHVTLVVLPSFLYIAEARSTSSPARRLRSAAKTCSGPTRAPSPVRSAAAQLRRTGLRIRRDRTRRDGGASSAETDDMIAAKTAAAFRNGLTPILCVGEALRSDTAGRGQTLPGAAGFGAVARFRAPPRDRWSSPTSRTGRSAPQKPASPESCRRNVSRRFAITSTRSPDFAGSRVIYGGSAGPGLLTRLRDSVDGLVPRALRPRPVRART